VRLGENVETLRKKMYLIDYAKTKMHDNNENTKKKYNGDLQLELIQLENTTHKAHSPLNTN